MEPELYEIDGQLTFLDPDEYSAAPAKKKAKRSPTRKDIMELVAVPIQVLDLTPGHGDLLGDAHWEMYSPLLEDGTLLNTGVAPREPILSSLSSILEPHPDRKYYLSRTACLGILRRADEREKELPEQLKAALMAQAGLAPIATLGSLKAYHINQRDEGIDLCGVSGALMATTNMQMQTFVTGEPIAIAANQRDEVRDPNDVAGALGEQPKIKQLSFISEPCLTPWDTQQKRIILPDSVAPTLAGADGGGGRAPGGLLFAAFSAGAGAKAGGIGYSEEVAPTLKGSASGNCMPSLLCLNDQGGERMDVTVEQTTTLRAQAGGHQPLICLNDQGGAVMECSLDVSGTLRAQEHGHQPLVFENHGIDSRYTGPHRVVPTISARAGTGGNNLPLVAAPERDEAPVICIIGNAIDRQPQNDVDSIGVSEEDIAFTSTATDRHAVFSRQRVDVFKEGDVVSTESARQHKDATDLVYQATVGALTSSDRKGPNSQYVGQDKLVVEGPLLIRRLTPLECERLQGFPDLWTAIPSAADSARYKALGNSVAIPCVEFIMGQIARAILLGQAA